MKKLFAVTLLCSAILIGCSASNEITNIQPKSGSIEIPVNGELRIWNDLPHRSFTVTITNSSPNQSVELYKVKKDGNEKWVSPSLLANTSIDVNIPTDGHLFIKNFNNNDFTVTYKITK
jgi:hypothetical protein